MNDYLATPHLDGSLDVSDIPRKRLGLRYTAPDGSPRPFDLYYPPEGAGPFPPVVNISGGGWYYGRPSSIHLGRAVHSAVARGYAFASLACTSSREIAGEDRVEGCIIPGAGHSDPRFKSEETCGRILDFLDRARRGA